MNITRCPFCGRRPESLADDEDHCCELDRFFDAEADYGPAISEATEDALAADAAYIERCEAADWRMACRLAGGDAWVCERLGLAFGMVEVSDA